MYIKHVNSNFLISESENQVSVFIPPVQHNSPTEVSFVGI